MIAEVALATVMLTGAFAAPTDLPAIEGVDWTPVPQGTTYWDYYLGAIAPLVVKPTGSKYTLAWAFDALWCEKGTMQRLATRFRYFGYEDSTSPAYTHRGSGELGTNGGRLFIWDASTNDTNRYSALQRTAAVKKAGAKALKRCEKEMN